MTRQHVISSSPWAYLLGTAGRVHEKSVGSVGQVPAGYSRHLSVLSARSLHHRSNSPPPLGTRQRAPRHSPFAGSASDSASSDPPLRSRWVDVLDGCLLGTAGSCLPRSLDSLTAAQRRTLSTSSSPLTVGRSRLHHRRSTPNALNTQRSALVLSRLARRLCAGYSRQLFPLLSALDQHSPDDCVLTGSASLTNDCVDCVCVLRPSKLSAQPLHLHLD
jgi:hypothetical protein